MTRGKSLKDRLARVATLATIASYLIAGTISLFTFKSALPDWLFFLLQIVIAALGVATVWVILGSSARLRRLVFRERRKLESEERRKQDLRDDFRIFVYGVKNMTDYYLWDALQAIVRQGAGTETYQAMVYGLLARSSLMLGNIYRDFDPSTVSTDLLTHYKSKLEKLHTQFAAQVLQYAPQVRSSGETFSKLISNMNDTLWELQTDMGKKAEPRPF